MMNSDAMVVMECWIFAAIPSGKPESINDASKTCTPSVDPPPVFSSASVEDSPNLAFHETQNFTPSQVMFVVI
jgi:hypothetical protein